MATSGGSSPTIGSTGAVRWPAGQRLYCTRCGSEVEIISACPCEPPDMILQCCGLPMEAQTGQNVHLNVE